MPKRLGIKFKKDLLNPESPTIQGLLGSKEFVTIASGPRNCSKSLHIEGLLFKLHDRIPGLQTAVIRYEQRTIKSTIIKQMNNKLLRYPITDKRNPWRYNKTDMVVEFDNNGSMGFYGMDGDKVLGGEFHAAYYSQCEQQRDEDQLSNLLGCIDEFRAGKHLIDREGNPYYRFIGDANPGGRFHFLKKWERDGFAKFYNFTHKDHPLFRAEDGTLNERGKDTVDGLLRIYPEGYMRNRMVWGQWDSPEGAVFPQYQPEKHDIEINRQDFGSDTKWRWSIDWGGITACGLYAERSPTDHVLFKEIYRKGQSVQDIIAMMRAIEAKYTIPRITDCFVDHEIDNRHQMVEAGYPYTLAVKTNKAGRIEDVKTALSNGWITFNVNSLDDPDPELRDKPHKTVHELASLAYKPPDKMTGAKSDDLPDPELPDHACDDLQYYVSGAIVNPRPEFYGSVIKRDRPPALI